MQLCYRSLYPERDADEMSKKRMWKCDYKDCEEIAEWYRKWKGELLKLCTKHEAYLRGKRCGRSLDLSELDDDDLSYLEYKEKRGQEKK